MTETAFILAGAGYAVLDRMSGLIDGWLILAIMFYGAIAALIGVPFSILTAVYFGNQPAPRPSLRPSLFDRFADGLLALGLVIAATLVACLICLILILMSPIAE